MSHKTLFAIVASCLLGNCPKCGMKLEQAKAGAK